jgi:glycosyltransferase involved in cell wall biosynthesis
MNKVSRSFDPQLGTYLLSDLPRAAVLVLRHEGVRGFVRKLGRLIARSSRKGRVANAGPPAAHPTITPDAHVAFGLQIPVHAHDDRMRVLYVTEATGISGGHRQVFEQLNRLTARGHVAELYTLGAPPNWFDLRVPVRTFEGYDALVRDLGEQDAVKVATWWATAEHVLHAAQNKGTPVYLVQDLETSYYEHDRELQEAVLASYLPDFSYLTDSSWVRARLAELGLDASLISPGIDLDTYRPLDIERRTDVVLTVGRSHYLKNLTLSWLAWRRLPKPRPELWMYGVEPDLGNKFGARYFTNPTDEEVNMLLNTTTVFLQTSRHEGFGLPILEAMAAGTPVICTDAHGNRDFCFDGVNCLMPEARSDAVAESLEKVFQDGKIRDGLSREGLQTARRFDWNGQIGQLETFLKQVQARAAAGPRVDWLRPKPAFAPSLPGTSP